MGLEDWRCTTRNDPRAISGLSRSIAARNLTGVLSGKTLAHGAVVMPRGTAFAVITFFFAAWPAVAPADVVVLQNGRAYGGVIERASSQSVELFDGNLRRVVATGDIKEIIRERADTSWVIVGDLMIAQRDWTAAAAAYRRALETTRQPDVLLRRLDYVASLRYEVEGSKQANALLEAGQCKSAALGLAAVVRNAGDVARKHYWTERLARAYVGLATPIASSETVAVDPHLVYALAIAPDCGPAHTALGERLEMCGFGDAAHREFLAALDFDPTDQRARSRLAARGETWTYDPARNDRSGLRDWIERRTPLATAGEAPLTTKTLARAMEKRVEQAARLSPPPARMLLAAYLLEPTVALAYEGALPYPGDDAMAAAILKETANTSETTIYDALFIKTGIAARIDPRFARAIASVRSKGEPDYQSEDGGHGLIPLRRPQWEIAMGALGQKWLFEDDAFDAEKNVRAAYAYLDWLRQTVLKPYAGTRLNRLERIHGNL